jgi:DNA-binding transcriptional LysR family regulator
MPILSGFHARYPDIEIELGVDDRHVDLIAQQIDVAVRTGALGDSTLVARKLGEGTRVICASRGYLRRNGRQHRADDAGRHHNGRGEALQRRQHRDGGAHHMRGKAITREYSPI